MGWKRKKSPKDNSMADGDCFINVQEFLCTVHVGQNHIIIAFGFLYMHLFYIYLLFIIIYFINASGNNRVNDVITEIHLKIFLFSFMYLLQWGTQIFLWKFFFFFLEKFLLQKILTAIKANFPNVLQFKDKSIKRLKQKGKLLTKILPWWPSQITYCDALLGRIQDLTPQNIQSINHV